MNKKIVNFGSNDTKRTNPELWDKIVSDVKSGAKYGIEGQWNARKASYAVQQYKAQGGGYKGRKPTVRNNKLKKWLDEDWTTYNGKPAIKRDTDGTVSGVSRYLPKKAWEGLSPQQVAATNRKKRSAYQEGKQFAPNAKAAREASRKARGFDYMNS